MPPLRVHLDMCLLGYCRLTGGGYKSKHEKFHDMERKVSTLMVRGPDGELQRESRFQRVTWRMRSKPLETRVFQKLFFKQKKQQNPQRISLEVEMFLKDF